eukprot:scaffold3102_cov351-Prasinococcus_capsulatus_cf.AAC.2
MPCRKSSCPGVSTASKVITRRSVAAASLPPGPSSSGTFTPQEMPVTCPTASAAQSICALRVDKGVAARHTASGAPRRRGGWSLACRCR